MGVGLQLRFIDFKYYSQFDRKIYYIYPTKKEALEYLKRTRALKAETLLYRYNRYRRYMLFKRHFKW